MSVPIRGPLAAALRLAAREPVALAAAFLAALIAEAMLTMQPLFLRAFIDQAQGGAAPKLLLYFPLFMLAAAGLAYLFDLIAVAIRFRLQRGLTRRLRELYVEFSDKPKPETTRFALRSGLTGLAQLALALSLDLLLVLARLSLILGGLGLGDPAAAWAAALVLALGAALSYATTARLGRLSRTRELLAERLGAEALAGRPGWRRTLDRGEMVADKRFGLLSINVLMSFLIFRVLPVAVLFWHVYGAGGTVGSLASAFLYLSMLRAPYQELVGLLQDNLVAFSESSVFAVELERGLKRHAATVAVPFGLIWERDTGPAGRPLSQALAEREVLDDMPPGAPGKLERLRALAERSRGASILLYSEDPAVRAFAHFVRRGGTIRTALSELA